MPDRFRPQDDHRVVELALGLTDLVGHWDHEDEPRLGRDRPVAGQRRAVGDPRGWRSPARARRVRRQGARPPKSPASEWPTGTSRGPRSSVLPGTSGANQRKDGHPTGRPNRLSWWRDLAQITEPERSARPPPVSRTGPASRAARKAGCAAVTARQNSKAWISTCSPPVPVLPAPTSGSGEDDVVSPAVAACLMGDGVGDDHSLVVGPWPPWDPRR